MGFWIRSCVLNGLQGVSRLFIIIAERSEDYYGFPKAIGDFSVLRKVSMEFFFASRGFQGVSRRFIELLRVSMW